MKFNFGFDLFVIYPGCLTILGSVSLVKMYFVLSPSVVLILSEFLVVCTTFILDIPVIGIREPSKSRFFEEEVFDDILRFDLLLQVVILLVVPELSNMVLFILVEIEVCVCGLFSMNDIGVLPDHLLLIILDNLIINDLWSKIHIT